jgi:cytoskeletal protein RodZ
LKALTYTYNHQISYNNKTNTMHFSKFILAVLPALALAEETTTQTSTAVVTKTYYLSTVRTVTATGESTTAVETSAEIISTAVVEEKTTFLPVAHNTTTPASTPKATASAGATDGSSEPSQVPENAGAAVTVGKFAMVGVAGAIAAALL